MLHLFCSHLAMARMPKKEKSKGKKNELVKKRKKMNPKEKTKKVF